MSSPAHVTIHDHQPPIAVTNGAELDLALQFATDESRRLSMLGAIMIKAANGNTMTIVVGSDETVLSFDYAHGNPPYYASKGSAPEDEPVMTCYLHFDHHTEFQRGHVIPLVDGIKAVQEFVASGELPGCVEWEEV